ncbi:MAG: hypothetical protein CMQ29_10850 [Gammaproteobacteria bacterium]|nr:hypothetical protein [Gammaproteobacteria bacterium]|tara:strand:- start:4106 stop:5191 length:1086 start_codon:yes stop_codon:yes gene_type:complete
MSQTHLTDEQKEAFVSDGFIIVRKAVPADTVQRARKLITDSLPKDERRLLVPAELATHPDVQALFNDTCLPELLRNEMGPFPPVISCQVAVTPANDKLGGSPFAHVDGSWGGLIPGSADEIDWDVGRPKDAARWFGANDDLRGTNDGQLWQDPDRRISLGSYTALVGVCLNDQLELGRGQFAVLRGMHEAVETAFQQQRNAGSVIGPEGLDWPRIYQTGSGRPALNGLPGAVRTAAREAGKDKEAKTNWPWPELTPVLLAPGDAVIALHSCPHTPTPNYGPEPRMNIYFRIRRTREGSPHEGSRRLGHGVSDHLDRGYYGQFLDYPDDYDPWQTSIDKLCDHWSEWDGLQAQVAAARSGKP